MAYNHSYTFAYKYDKRISLQDAQPMHYRYSGHTCILLEVAGKHPVGGDAYITRSGGITFGDVRMAPSVIVATEHPVPQFAEWAAEWEWEQAHPEEAKARKVRTWYVWTGEQERIKDVEVRASTNDAEETVRNLAQERGLSRIGYSPEILAKIKWID